jgi:hypothetical protein
MTKGNGQPLATDGEAFKYLSIEELRALSPDELKAWYEQIPADRAERYSASYRQALLDAGAIGSDELEYQIALHLLDQYKTRHFVPTGTRWSLPAARVVEAAFNNVPLAAPEDARLVAGDGAQKKAPALPLILGGAAVVIALFLMLRGRGGPAKAAFAGTVTPTATETPVKSPTPTPIAIENIDDLAGASEKGGVSFPVKLTVLESQQTQPMVYVVQRRKIALADWRYTDNPGVATFISGLTVRPIIGIPYSTENAAEFASMSDGTTFEIVTNTGALLRFDYVTTLQVQNTDTSIFNQTGPGIVLILIGQTGADGSPTLYRTAVTASYDASQELRPGSNVISAKAMEPVGPVVLPTVTLTPTPIRVTTMNLISAGIGPDFLLVRFRLINVRSEPVTVTGDDIWVAFGYAPRPDEPRVPSEGMMPVTILPDQAADFSVYFKYDGSEPYATIGIGADSEWVLAMNLK